MAEFNRILCNNAVWSNLEVYSSLNTPLLAVLKWKGTTLGVRAEEKTSISSPTRVL
jgi:hypothetical protein